MKILVTGGAGFIGSHVVDACVHDGHDVFVIDDLSTGMRNNINPSSRFYEADICDSKIRAILNLEKPEIIIHHAAQMNVRKSVEDPQVDIRINVCGLINILQACEGIPVRKIIFASSGGAIYGEQSEFPASETHALNPMSPYGVSKLAGEKYLNYYSSIRGFKTVFLRYANIYGPRQNPLGEAGVISIFIDKMLKGGSPVINGDGKQTRDYVHVSDVVIANLLSLDDRVEGVFNIGTGVETDVITLFNMLAELLDSPCKKSHGPSKIGEQKRSCLSGAMFEKMTGWRANLKLADGLMDTIKWFRL